MNKIIAAIALLLSAVASAQAQSTSAKDIVGLWAGSLQGGDGKPRALNLTGVTEKSAGEFTFEGEFGFASGGHRPVSDGVGRISGDQVTLKFMSASGAAVSLSGKADGPLAGTFTTKNGQSVPLALTRQAEAASRGGKGAFASADELKAMVSGKAVTFSRKRDGETIVWNLAADGSFTARNFDRRSTDGGKWEIQAPGALCMKFNGTGDNPCSRFFFRREADKYVMQQNRRLDGPAYADVVSIK